MTLWRLDDGRLVAEAAHGCFNPRAKAVFTQDELRTQTAAAWIDGMFHAVEDGVKVEQIPQ